MSSTKAQFAMPSRLVLDEDTATEIYGKFTAQPFEKGFGHTICGDVINPCAVILFKQVDLSSV